MAHGAFGHGETNGLITPGRAGGDQPWSIAARSGAPLMEALLVSFGTVTLAETGDRTQLLSLMLAAR
jgi:hypothetical protein